MDEFLSYSVLNFIRSLKKSDLCRFVYCASIELPPDQLLKFFARCAKEKFANNATGLLLVYPVYIVHILEAPEDEIFHICSYLVNAEPRCLGASKCFPMQIDAKERFFEKWHARKIVAEHAAAVICDEELSEDFQHAKEMYRRIIDDFYTFCNDLRASRIVNHASFVSKLDALVTTKDSRLPGMNDLRSLLQTSWGECLEKLVEDYRRGISPRDIEEVVWPFPTKHCPPFDTME